MPLEAFDDMGKKGTVKSTMQALKLYMVSHREVRVPKHRAAIRGSCRELAWLHTSSLQHWILADTPKPNKLVVPFTQAVSTMQLLTSKVTLFVAFIAGRFEEKKVSKYNIYKKQTLNIGVKSHFQIK